MPPEPAVPSCRRLQAGPAPSSTRRLSDRSEDSWVLRSLNAARLSRNQSFAQAVQSSVIAVRIIAGRAQSASALANLCHLNRFLPKYLILPVNSPGNRAPVPAITEIALCSTVTFLRRNNMGQGSYDSRPALFAARVLSLSSAGAAMAQPVVFSTVPRATNGISPTTSRWRR